MTINSEIVATIRQTLDVFFQPGDVTELRVLNVPGAGVVSGYYDDLDRLAHDAAKWDGKAPGLFVTLNPVKPELLDRSPNRLRTHCKRGDLTQDVDVLKRSWIAIDLDPARPPDVPSNDQEHYAAIARGRVIRSVLAMENWPGPILADSGNGSWLFYRFDAPNDANTRERVRAALATIAERFSTATVKIDRSVSNASRIVRLFGTRNLKGANTPERPHRRSCILELPLENP